MLLKSEITRASLGSVLHEPFHAFERVLHFLPAVIKIKNMPLNQIRTDCSPQLPADTLLFKQRPFRL